jgi:NAD-dependent deacetylase
MPTLDDMIRAVAARLAGARRVAVLTGAGISAESGIRTFRGMVEGGMAGLWKDFDPQKLATPEAFAADPELVSRWYDWRRVGCLAAEPNAGHIALAQLEDRMRERGGTWTLLTQNVDGLHQRGGSRNVVELHGSIHIWRCTRTGAEVRPGPTPFQIFPPPSDAGDGALLRPGVVWFGEALPVAAVRAAAEAVAACDVFLSIGTSSVVYPAAGFVEEAGANGALTVEINPEPTPLSRRVDFSLRGKAGEVLPRLLHGVTPAVSGGQQLGGSIPMSNRTRAGSTPAHESAAEVFPRGIDAEPGAPGEPWGGVVGL